MIEVGQARLPVPLPSEAPDGPGAMLAMMKRLSLMVIDPLPTVADLPMVDNFPGMTVEVLSTPGAVWRWNGVSWEMIGVPRFANAAARDAAIVTPVLGMQAFHADTQLTFRYFTTVNSAAAGWYDESTFNFFVLGSAVNPAPAAWTTIPGSLLNFTTLSPRTKLVFAFGAELIQLANCRTQIRLDIDGAPGRVIGWTRAEATPPGGSVPQIPITGGSEALVAAGNHTANLAISSTGGANAAITGAYMSMIGTPGRYGRY